MLDPGIEGKAALITGANHGIGAATAEAFGQQGARGIRYITSFAVWIDAAYVAQYGEPPLGEYGARLRGARTGATL